MKQNNRMTVHLDDKPIYDIVLSDSFDELADELKALGCENKKLCIVTDSNVASYYLEEITALVSKCCRKVTSYVFPAGEANKNLNTVKGVFEHLIQEKYDRKDYMIALGGGVVGDLCGFAAATYLRGIGFIQIPTTLLSQVDSSIGGKTGVDLDSYKNMVGAFHMPKLVYENVTTLKTLSDEQFSAGMGEVIKHGLIRDKDYYQWLLMHLDEIMNRDPEICKIMIKGSNIIKREVVQIDPTEQNERATLNFGHTLGHAIEKLMDFSFLHGHCVALGALAAMDICRSRGFLTTEDVEGFKMTMKRCQMPTKVKGIDAADVIEATKNDKKMEAGIIKFILIDQVGHAYIDKTVTEAEMKQALCSIM